jgi:ferrous iron transport protein B
VAEVGSGRRVYRVAVVGNPNVGKSTLFTRLTREIAHIANWPGTTVERKEGVLHLDGADVVLVDLPGVYSLAGVSVEEKVARDYILRGDWDAVLVLVDSLAPERTLYLAVHVLELTGRAVVALTKWDAAHARGVHVRVESLRRALGVPVVAVSAVTGEGLGELVKALREVLEGGGGEPLKVDYGLLEPAIAEVERELAGLRLGVRAPLRWIALKLLEGDEDLAKLVEGAGGGAAVGRARELREAVARSAGVDPEELAVARRFRFVDEVSRRAVVRARVSEGRGTLERLLLSPVAGPLLSLAILVSAYALVFSLNTGFPLNALFKVVGLGELAERLESFTLSGLISSFFDAAAGYLRASLPPSPLASLLADGLLGGLALVLSFLPLILTALLVLAFLEDSGVGPYAAASLHRLFQRVGLSGRAAYPLLVALGCNVPAVMASRTAPEEAERRQLMAAMPFVPCQARLVVLLAFASAYFADSPLLAAAAFVTAYAIALALFAATSLAVRRVLGAGEAPELALELPPLHKPSLRVLWWISWDYAKHYLKRAGLVIFGLSLVVWGLTSYGPSGPAEPGESYAAIAGRALAPLASFLGLSGGKAEAAAFAALAGLVAKETILLSLAALQGSTDPVEALRALELSRAQALALAVFYTAYMPCAATIATIYKESGSARFAAAAVAWSILASAAVSWLAYAAASALGL